MRCVLDHLVVTAPSLDEGAAWIERHLGVAPGPGGRHPRMGTHNRVLRLGAAAYLEVIAIDPDGAAPGRPRWFGLDDPAARRAPRLSSWVARTGDLAAAPADEVAALGVVEAMTRGEREWLFTLPPSGRPPLDGVGPAVIEWRRPARSVAVDLPDAGLALARFEIRHPEPARVRALLASLGLDGAAVLTAGEPGLRAEIDTPSGRRVLGFE